MRGLDMPATQVELDYGDKSFDRIVNRRHGKEGLGMCHEAVNAHVSTSSPIAVDGETHFVMRSSMDRGSSMKVGKVTLLRSAPGRSWEMMCMRTAWQQVSLVT